MKVSNRTLTILIIIMAIPFLVAAVTNFRNGVMIDDPTGSKAVFWYVDKEGVLKRGADREAIRSISFDLDDWRRVFTGSTTNIEGFNPRIGSAMENKTINANYPYLESGAMSSAIVWPQFHPLDPFMGLSNGVGKTTIVKGFPWANSAELATAGNFGVDAYFPRAVSPIFVQFKVPNDFLEKPEFVLTLNQDATARAGTTTSNPIRIGYAVAKSPSYDNLSVHGNGNYWPKTYTDYSIFSNVKVTTAGYNLSPRQIVLPITRDTLGIGDDIVFMYWRIRDISVVDKLQHLNAQFRYRPAY